MAARARGAAELAAEQAEQRSGMKLCDVCGTRKPATPEFFPRHKRRRDGLATRCTKCNREAVKEWRMNNRQHFNRIAKRRYWEKRKEGLHRILLLRDGKKVAVWQKLGPVAPPAPAGAVAPVAPVEATLTAVAVAPVGAADNHQS